MVWGAISFHGRSYLLRIEDILNINGYVHEVLYNPKSFPSFKASLELCFSRIMHAHMLQRLFETYVQPDTCNFFLDLLMRRICHLLSTFGIWLVGVSLVIGTFTLYLTRPAALKDELLLRIQAIWNSLPQAEIQNLFDSMLRRIVALIAARGGYTKY
ncbi:uncharacterized protein TNCV_548741 [Trichonephila clavipes]|nr:uncharacterized protein TNCV_548741 [Trichonephila clavipes]